MTYQAYEISNLENQIETKITLKELPDLKKGEVQIKIYFSSVNYKDALATQPKSGVIPAFPIVPGIDLAGKVTKSKSETIKVGDEVLVTGFDLGIKHPGGLAEYATVPEAWVIKRPTSLSLSETMQVGTAGFTAGLAVLEFLETEPAENKATPILITGATGGVGSFTLAYLKQMGYTNLTALTRKNTVETLHYLKELGATNVLTPVELLPEKVRVLDKQRFSSIFDAVGGQQLNALIPMISYGGNIFMSGNAGGMKFETTVLPFILRGISLRGIDSVYCPRDRRLATWQLIGAQAKPDFDKLKIQVIPLDKSALEKAFETLLSGENTGRYLVEMNNN